MRCLLGVLLGAGVGVVLAIALVVQPPETGLDAPPPAPATAVSVPALAPTPHTGAPPPATLDGPAFPDALARCRPLRSDWVEVVGTRCHVLAALPVERTRELAALCDGVLAWLGDAWGARGGDRRVSVVIAPDRDAFGAVFRALSLAADPGWALGVYAPAWDCVVAFEQEDLASTLLHEAFHAYVQRRAAGTVPTWWNEGYASYFGTAEWKGHGVRFRDHHHAAFLGLRGAVLAGRWIPLAELTAMAPARFYDRSTAPVAYLESYAVVFALEHLVPQADRELLRRVRAAVLDGAAGEVPPEAVARAEAVVLDLILGADLPEVPDLAARLRALAPEAGDEPIWQALASAATGPAGAGVEGLPSGDEARRLAAALRARVRGALTGADAAAAAYAGVALLDAADPAPVLRHAPAPVLGRLDWQAPLPLADLADALRARVGSLRARERERFPPACAGELAAVVELTWQLQRAWEEPGSAAEALRDRLTADLLLPDAALFWSGASRLPRFVGRPWDAWAEMLEGRATDPVGGSVSVDAARALGRLARSGDDRSVDDALALAIPRPEARAALLAELAGGSHDEGVAPLLQTLANAGGAVGEPAALYGLLRLREPPGDRLASSLVGRGGVGERILLDRIDLTHPSLPVAQVENQLADRDPAIRALALRALGWYPGDKTSTLLLRALRERRGAEQCAAAGAVLRLLAGR